MEKPKILSDSVWKRIAQVLCDDAIAGFRASSLELAGRIRNEVEAHYEPLIQQAKAEVAEDIGGLVCCLAGNLMLEDKEAGALLAKQLQPLVDTIKLRYLPNLPRKEDCPELVNKQVERARAEVARQTDMLLCVLIRNVALKDVEAASLLTSQLTPIMDLLKSKYGGNQK